MSLLAELKRRNVIKVGAAYLALAWVITQVTGTVAPAFGLPDWTLKLVVWIALLGFPFVVVFAWVFELTPEGLKRESEIDRSQSITHLTGKRLDYIIIAMLGVAMLMFAADRFVPRNAAPAPAPASDSRAEARSVESAGVVDARGSDPGVSGPTESDAAASDPAVDRASARQAVTSTAHPAPDEKSIAVLPFVNMSADKDQEFFSDGISEELLNQLARIPELQVTSRSSAFAFKGEKIDIPVVARKLGVAHVLEGSVRKSGNKVRITAQLIDARSDKHLWSDTYDRDLTDIFAVQDEIAGAVVSQLKVTLLGGGPQATKTDPKAYTLYLQGRQLYAQNTAEGFDKSIELFRQALGIDPRYAAAWTGLAATYATQADNGLRPIDEAYALAREAVNKALAVDPQSAVAYAALGWIAKDYDNDLATAAQHMSRALELAPTDPRVIANGGSMAQGLGRLDNAIAVQEYMVAHDPVNAAAYSGLGTLYFYAGRLDDAVNALRTASTLGPARIGVHYNLGAALLLRGDAAAALAEMQAEGAEIWRLIGLALAQHAVGRRADSDAALAQGIAKYEKLMAYNIAYVYAYRGEADRAFEWLDKAVAWHDGGLQTVHVDPLLANLHDDPRWLPFLRKLGKAPEQLAAIPFEVKLPR